MRALPLLLLASFAAGCAAPLDGLAPAGGTDGVRLAPLFGEPVTLTTEGPGFEPSIDVGPDGIVYAAAAKTRRPNDGERLASWLWYSADGGATWQDLPSPANVHKAMFGFEGDTAVDAKGRFYFVDTYLPDNTIHRWTPAGGRPSWDFSRPVQGTIPLVDDRPWLVAHGDGVVYLMSNNAEDAPARMWLSISTDGGLTWLRGQGFPGMQWCMPAASPADDGALVACHEGGGRGARLLVHRSHDRGASWLRQHEAAMTLGAGYLPPGAAFDAGGHAYVVWHDERVEWSGVQDATWTGDAPARIVVARGLAGAGWEEIDVTPFQGRFGMSYACAGREGTLATTFYATEDLAPDDATEWRAYALVSADAHAPEPSWTLSPLVDGPVAVGPMPPRDLFECAVGPDNAVHAVVQRDEGAPARQPGDGIVADVLHVRQVAGPNLG